MKRFLKYIIALIVTILIGSAITVWLNDMPFIQRMVILTQGAIMGILIYKLNRPMKGKLK